jgi:molecular chaperone GrpE
VSRPGGTRGGSPGGAAGGRPPGTPGAGSGDDAAAAAGPAAPGAPATARAGGPTADGAGAGGPAAGGPGSAADVAAKLAERTADLQRLQAEYANYRKRVERDRMAVREQALSSVLSELLPVLDDIGRAREHGELTGGFKSVAESLESAATKLGLTTYGENGDPFDPNVHDALMHSYSDEMTEPTCVRILQSGYKVGERILRPARVAVAEPGHPDDGPAAGESAGPAGDQDQSSPGQDEADDPGDHAPTGTD